jgi:tRNA threonylcarbamoyladenosine modification (KEOPS) complex Cgi121 subunit
MEARCYAVGGEADPTAARGRLVRLHPKLLVQAVRLETAANEFFVEMICAETVRAQASHVLLARKPEIDLLLRLASTTQISVAIAKAGARKGAPFLLIAAGDSKTMRSIRVPCGWKRLARAKLSTAELERIERAALLNAARG